MAFALPSVVACLALLALLVACLRARRARPARGAAAAQPARIPLDLDTDGTAAWIWRHLVPAAGQAATVQGELLRAVEKLRWEACNNGNINWDDGFERLHAYLHNQLVERATLPGEMKLAVLADLARLRQAQPCVDEHPYERLTAAVVAFARLHTLPIPRDPDPALHR